MPAKRPPPPPLSFSLRDASGRLSYDGALDKCLELLFGRLPDALARRKMIDVLEKAHAKMLAREAGPDVEQQTTAQVSALASQVHPDMARPSVRVGTVIQCTCDGAHAQPGGSAHATDCPAGLAL
jgi:hypothetical protein